MIFKISKYLALVVMTVLSLTACVKDDVEDLGDRGATFVKLQGAPVKPFFFDVFNDVRSFDLFSVRKDANANSSLSQSTVTLTSVPDYIDRYNDDNGTTFEALPDSIFTLTNQSFVKSGDGYTVNFAPGEFAQEFSIGLNGAKWDVSHTYALAFAVSEAGGASLASGLDTILVTLSVKNEYDGIYEVVGVMVDNVNPALVALSPMEVSLVTDGPNTNIMYDHVGWHDYIHPISNAGAYSGYGSFAPIFEFDSEGNVISVVNAFGQPAANGRSAGIDPSGVNKFDKATKSMKVKFFMYQPGSTLRTTFDQEWTYLGPR